MINLTKLMKLNHANLEEAMKARNFARTLSLAAITVYVAGAYAGSINPNAGWYAFCHGASGQAIFDTNPVCINQGIGLTANTISFTSAVKTELRVTDAFISGDSFLVMIDGRSRITSSSVPWNAVNVFNPNDAFADPRYSHGSWILDPGSHKIDIFSAASLGSGAAYLSVRDAVDGAPNPVVDHNLKWWSAIYLDLFKRVQADLVWIGDLVSIGTGKSVAEVALKRLWISVMEKLTALTPDPRDEAVLKIGKAMENVMKVAALLGGSGDAVAAGAAVAMSKITVNATVDVLGALAADPVRNDFSTVRMSSGPISIAQLDALSGFNAFTDAQVRLTKCSAALLDGTQVALLAAERAWGAANASESDWFRQQSAAYTSGITKANAAVDNCSDVLNDLSSSLAALGIEDLNLASLDLGYSSLTAGDVSSLRGTLIASGVFSADEIDAAIKYSLNEGLTTRAGKVSEFIKSYSTELNSLNPLPSSLEVPEPNSMALAALAISLLLTRRVFFRNSSLRGI